MSSRSSERRLRIALVPILLSAAAARLFAAAPVDEILGAWDGTSTCVKSPEFPSCHDEVVVYEFRKPAAGGEAATCAAYKIVGGEKQLMGELDFGYDAKEHAWTSALRTDRVHALWTFFVRQDAITGTLVDLPSKRVVRNVAARRRPSE